MIDFPDGVKTAELQDQYTRQDLIDATNKYVDHVLSLIRNIPDLYVTFQPEDPDAHDPHAPEEDITMAWTLNHVILHITASSEEAAARGASLARGVRVFWRDRYEPHWDTITTTAQLAQRLEESRRMRLAYLDAWPDDPQLDVVYAPNERSVAYFGEMNAVGMTLSGPRHEADHFEQIAEIIRQAGEAVGPGMKRQ